MAGLVLPILPVLVVVVALVLLVLMELPCPIIQVALVVLVFSYLQHLEILPTPTEHLDLREHFGSLVGGAGGINGLGASAAGGDGGAAGRGRVLSVGTACHQRCEEESQTHGFTGSGLLERGQGINSDALWRKRFG